MAKKEKCILSTCWEKIKNFFGYSKSDSALNTAPENAQVAAGQNSPSILDKLYGNRQEFNIISLTGPIGCGADEFGELVAQPFVNWKNRVRSPKDVKVATYKEDGEVHHEIIKQTIFKQKYTICYNFLAAHPFSYNILKYNKVSLLYALYWVRNTDGVNAGNFSDKIKETLYTVLQDTEAGKKYCKEQKEDGLFQRIFNELFAELETIDYSALWEEVDSFGNITQPFELDDDKKSHLSECFVNEEKVYSIFYRLFCTKLKEKEFFIYCYLWHRLGNNIRTYGSPTKRQNAGQEHLFDLIELLNIIIKEAPHDSSRRFCIDSLRNSLEIRYLNERYTAFYQIALYNTLKPHESVIQLVNKYNKSLSANYKTKVIEHLDRLSRIEGTSDDYKKGKFSSPDIEQCVAQSEIHIICQEHNEESKQSPEFYSTAEQWMKFTALMQHPGLITPSSDERCMEIAYTAKFNSGCVSRQVGAVITNAEHAIRTIGWNEVPYGQVSCGLRSISDLVRADFKGHKEFMYSDFERGKSNQTDIYGDGKTFQEKIAEDYQAIIGQMEREMPMHPVFCFREMHNKYKGEKNQVFGRSLHAEENAMMQITRSGGEGLHDGIIYVTASPCELCSRKLYQIGVRRIVYIDPYPGIAREQTIASGYRKPTLVQYRGAYGATYYKLYTPLIAPKDEQSIRCANLPCGLVKRDKWIADVQDFFKEQGVDIDLRKPVYSSSEIKQLEDLLENLKQNPQTYNNIQIVRVSIQIINILLNK